MKKSIKINEFFFKFKSMFLLLIKDGYTYIAKQRIINSLLSNTINLYNYYRINYFNKKYFL